MNTLEKKEASSPSKEQSLVVVTWNALYLVRGLAFNCNIETFDIENRSNHAGETA